jgi:hypothetical protein
MKSDDISFGINRRTMVSGLALLAKAVRAQVTPGAQIGNRTNHGSRRTDTRTRIGR